MNIRDGYNGRKVVTFGMQETLDDKSDNLTSMMNKLTSQGGNHNKPFKPKIYQGKRREQARNYYDQCNYQNRYISNSVDRRTSFRGRTHYGQNYRGRSQYVNNYRNDFRRGNCRGMQNYRGQNFRGGYRGNYRNDHFRRGQSRSRERQYSDTFRRIDRNSSSRSRSGSRASINRDRIRCFKCREYDHFAKDCLNSQTEKEPEQIQQMYNLDEDQTALMPITVDTYDNLIRTNLDNAMDHFNL